MMKCRFFAWTAALLVVAATSGNVLGQVAFLEDFEVPLPGIVTGFPGGWSFYGDGDSAADLTVVQEITDQVAFSGLQSYQITLDSSAINSWWYFGMGGFAGWFGEGYGAAQGQTGEDNPGNFVLSFDINIEGVNPGGDEGVGGSITLYKSDYEATYSVDLNNDGDMVDGYNLWASDFSTNLGQSTGWVHVEWNLGAGSAPTVPSTDGVNYFTEPVFDDETVFNYGFYPFNSNGGFGLDADNIILVDNFQLEFIPPPAPGPGDFDLDGDVDGQDFLVWQRDPNVGLLADWDANYNPAPPAIAAVPEPATLWAALSALALLASRRR